jgi:hypothetical protein
MKRHFPGLHQDIQMPPVPEGWFWVRIERATYVRRSAKPFYQLQFQILEPAALEKHHFNGRLYSTPKTLWKLLWFLQAFRYDADLLHRDEIEDRRLIGLSGIVRLAHARVGGRTFLNFEGFESEDRWPDLQPRADVEVP